MAKGITTIEGIEPIPDGTYTVNGIEKFISTSDDGTPIFKDQFNELKVQVKLRTPAGGDGPAMAVTPPEFVALVHAFGGTSFIPKPTERTMSSTLTLGQQLANAGGKTFTVMSKRGWANYSYDVNLPEGGYVVKFVDAHRPDFLQNNYDFFETEGMNGPYEYLWFDFEVIADQQNNPTVWEGYKISVRMTNIFVDRKEDEGSGDVQDAIELGHPVMIDGVNSRRWMYFMKYFAPHLLEEYDWKKDAAQSESQVCEPTQPQYPIIREAKKLGCHVRIWWGKKPKGKGFWFDMEDLPKSNMGMAEESPKERTATLDEFVTFVKSREWFMEDQETQYNVEEVFLTEDPLEFTDTGREWARQYLGGDAGAWARANLDMADRRFEHLTDAQLGSLMEQMEAQYK